MSEPKENLRLMARQFVIKVTNIIIHEHLPSGSRIHLCVPMEGRTD
jgi:hypothetical protein